MSALGYCAACRHYRDLFCRNPESPYGGKVRLPAHKCHAHKPARPLGEPDMTAEQIARVPADRCTSCEGFHMMIRTNGNSRPYEHRPSDHRAGMREGEE